MDALTGNEVQIGAFQIALHTDNIDEAKDEMAEKLRHIFKGETAHKILRITYRKNRKMIAVNAGHEHLMQDRFEEYIDEVIQKDYPPIVLQVYCFTSYTPLKEV